MIILILFAILLVSFVLFKVISKRIARRKRREAEERARREAELRRRAILEAERDWIVAEMSEPSIVDADIRLKKAKSMVYMAIEHPEDTALLVSKLMQAEPAEYLKKVVIFLAMLRTDTTEDIFKYMKEDEAKKLRLEISRLEFKERIREQDAILQEFEALLTAYQFIKSGETDKAREILEKTLGSQKADGLINLLTRTVQG